MFTSRPYTTLPHVTSKKAHIETLYLCIFFLDTPNPKPYLRNNKSIKRKDVSKKKLKQNFTSKDFCLVFFAIQVSGTFKGRFFYI